MKKFFTLMAVAMMAASASAVTPFKNLYVEANAAPTGAGLVYLEPKNSDEYQWIYDVSSEMGETAYIKMVFGENGGWEHVKGCNVPEEGNTDENGNYEVIVDTLPEQGYELVCLADKVLEDGIYGPDDCYPSIDGDDSNSYVVDFVWTGIDKVNCNNVNHFRDGTSENQETGSDRQSRQDCLDSGAFSDTPDTYIYAIFREVGADLPMFDPEKGTGIKNIAAEKVNKGCYTMTGQQLSAPVKGVNIVNGKKVVIK